MAKRTVILLEDDIDGGEATETVLFGLDGTAYEIDLNDHNAGQLRDAVAPFVGAAQRAGRPSAASTRPARASTRTAGTTTRTPHEVDPKAVRTWAEANGVQVSSQGRISAAVMEQYRTATA